MAPAQDPYAQTGTQPEAQAQPGMEMTQAQQQDLTMQGGQENVYSIDGQGHPAEKV